ncbi:24019_t:CDS:2 [Gigaspora margarita]|uniref:24019_t:CDS:1 n=1 Tax=Gigaspora margarita TaxID=4874 RepID=A0ABN7V5Z7_GIGMA|nr:24019_t:CDS:2 [Gigaspora margarita]
MEIILVLQKLFEKKTRKSRIFFENTATGVKQEPSKNNESKVRQKILLKTEYRIEDYEIFDKVLDQVPEKVKEDIVLRKKTNRENNQNRGE